LVAFLLKRFEASPSGVQGLTCRRTTYAFFAEKGNGAGCAMVTTRKKKQVASTYYLCCKPFLGEL